MTPRTFAAVAVSVLFLAIASWAARRDREPPPSRWPSVAELDSLSRYLAPGSAAPRLDDYAAYLPAAIPRPARGSSASQAVPALESRLSAIIISGDRRLAIIGDRSLRSGERLENGAVIVRIAPDHVVIRERGGSLRTLRLATGTDQSS
jgi:hypothetical protein